MQQMKKYICTENYCGFDPPENPNQKISWECEECPYWIETDEGSQENENEE